MALRHIQPVAAFALNDGQELRVRFVDGRLDIRLFEPIGGASRHLHATRHGVELSPELAGPLAQALAKADREVA